VLTAACGHDRDPSTLRDPADAANPHGRSGKASTAVPRRGLSPSVLIDGLRPCEGDRRGLASQVANRRLV
jgi:hypothetical protein